MNLVSPSEPCTLPALLDDPALDALIHDAAEPVVVECHFAGWEKPWRALTDDEWRELTTELGSRIRSALVDTGTSRWFALRHGAEILPEVMIFLGGRVVARLRGRATVARVAGAVEKAFANRRAEREARRELEVAERRRERLSTIRPLLARRSEDAALASAG